MVTQIEIPPRVRPVGDSGYLEELTKANFRSGFSWRVVREKWDAFRAIVSGCYRQAAIAKFPCRLPVARQMAQDPVAIEG